MEYQVLYEDYRKTLEVKSEKKIWFAECLRLALGKGASLPSARTAGTRQRIIIFLKQTRLCRVPGRVALGKEFKKIKKTLCRVLDRGHSAKIFF